MVRRILCVNAKIANVVKNNKTEVDMKSILTGILSLIIFFGAVPTANASDMNLANMEEIKKKKKGKKKKIGKKGKKSKKGFFSKVFGSK
tara:strand:+ start:367 stop:633 length:267 start_codon:yes stop_codon:yes gene_type:complete